MASLGNDLATLRKQQKLTLEDIHTTTKIPVHILQAIENETIFTDFEENKTYVRSYIRTYGKALKLEDEVIVKALDDYEVGIYSGRLMGDEGEEAPPPSEAEEPEKQPGKEAAEKSSAVKPEEEETTEEISRQEEVTQVPTISSVDWADMGHRFTPLQDRPRIWIGLGVILLIITTVIIFWIYQNDPDLFSGSENTGGDTQDITSPAVVPDSLQLNLTDSENASAAGNNTEQSLPDTLRIVVYAAYGKLEPVRIYTDVMGELNPYWIEEGEAYEFGFVNTLRLRGQYSRMELMVNGHPLENFRNRFFNPDTGMVVIERSVFENEDQWLQSPPDSSELNFLPPTIIRRRPTLN